MEPHKTLVVYYLQVGKDKGPEKWHSFSYLFSSEDHLFYFPSPLIATFQAFCACFATRVVHNGSSYLHSFYLLCAPVSKHEIIQDRIINGELPPLLRFQGQHSQLYNDHMESSFCPSVCLAALLQLLHKQSVCL